MFRALIRCIKYIEGPTHAFGSVDVILLHSGGQYVSASFVAIFRVVTVVHYTDNITAQQSGSDLHVHLHLHVQFKIKSLVLNSPHVSSMYVTTHSKQQFLTSDFLY